VNLRKAFERGKRRRRREDFAAEKRMLLWDRRFDANLYALGMRPSEVLEDGSIIWSAKPRGQA
jgi:hypothetical protein